MVMRGLDTRCSQFFAYAVIAGGASGRSTASVRFGWPGCGANRVAIIEPKRGFVLLASRLSARQYASEFKGA